MPPLFGISKRSLLTSNLNLNLRRKLIKWNKASGALLFMCQKRRHKKYRKERPRKLSNVVSEKHKKNKANKLSNEDVLRRVNEERSILTLSQ